MTKIGAIARYEILMAWRRRSLPILWFLLFVGVVGFSLLWMNATNGFGMSLSEILARQAGLPEYMVNTIPMISILFGGTLIFSVGISVMLTEVMPLDRQFKVYELLNALPVTRSIYLGGKVLGAWGGLIIGWALVGVVSAACLYLIFGAYDLRVVALLWVIALLPITLTSAAISVLVGSLVSSRRLALLFGLAALPVVIILIASAMTSIFSVGGVIEPLYIFGATGQQPVSASVIRSPDGKIIGWITDATVPQTSAATIITNVLGSLLLYAAVVACLWTLVWAWMRLREAR